MITTMGYEFLEAFDGEEDLKLANAAQPNLILLDIKLPDMNGYDVFQRLKNKPQLKAIPVIARTADINSPYDCLKAGFDSYLNKPVSKSAIMKSI
jgi:CheY-like chemotaxis protein